MHSVLSCLVSDIIGPAAAAQELVKTIAGDLGFEGGFALREYVRAVELVLHSLDLKDGDQVLISPLAPGAYGRAFRNLGIVPNFIDVREDDGCIDSDALGECLNTEAKAIFVHAPLGRVPRMEALYSLDIPVIVDLGEALGSREPEGILGSAAQYIIMPMEVDAIATTGGGTLVIAKSKKELKALEPASQMLGVDSYLSDLNASLGLVQWRDYPQALETRDMLHGIYLQSLHKGRHRTLSQPHDEESRAVSYSFPVVISGNISEVRRYARKKGVETLMAFSRRILDEYSDDAQRCTRAKNLMMGTLLFPLYPSLGKKDVQIITKVLSTLP